MYQEDDGGFHLADSDGGYSQQYFSSTFDIHLPHQTQSNAMDLQHYESSSPPLNLKLNVTRSLVHEINQKLEPPTDPIHLEPPKNSTKAADTSDQDKCKACNFPAAYVQIGHWNKSARHDMDIIIKFYFKKKKMALEALDGSLKTKLEVRFADISAIRFLNLNTPNEGILEILLEGKPDFFRETDPKPKKHTVWVGSNDFTNGQASFYRKHTLRFNAGSLEKLYNRIMAADPYLARLTSQPFPVNDENPCFDQDNNLTQISFQNPQQTLLPLLHQDDYYNNTQQSTLLQTGYPLNQYLVDDPFVAGSSSLVLPQHQFQPYSDQHVDQPYNFVERTPDYDHYSMMTTMTTTHEPIDYIHDFSYDNFTSSPEFRLNQQSYFPCQIQSFQVPFPVAPLSGVGIQGESMYGDGIFYQAGYK